MHIRAFRRSALDGPRRRRRSCHRCVAEAVDLVGRQRPVRRPEGEAVGQRPVPGLDALPLVDVEERRPTRATPPRRSAAPPRRRQRPRRRRRAARCRSSPAGTSRTAGPATGSALAATSTSTSNSAATVRAGRSSAASTLGCSSPAWPTSVPSASVMRAHRPGCHGAWPGSLATTTGTASAAATVCTAATMSLQSAARPGPHQPACSAWPVARMPARRGWAGTAAYSCSSVSASGREATPGDRRRAERAARAEDEAELVDRDVLVAARDVAAQRVDEAREDRRAQQRPLLGQRVGQPDRVTTVVVGRQHRAGRRAPRRRTGS